MPDSGLRRPRPVPGRPARRHRGVRRLRPRHDPGVLHRVRRPPARGYLRTPGRFVALAGPVGSGKSTYIGVLVHELLHTLGAELGAALVPCDDDTMADYHERYERHLYGAQRTVPKTAEHDGGRPWSTGCPGPGAAAGGGAGTRC